MIGLDTNVLVRFLVQDEPEQAVAAAALISGLTEAAPGFVRREVMVEPVWALEPAYGLDRADIARAPNGLLEARELIVEAADGVAVAADRYRKGGPGFADQMISLAGQGAGCRETATFDGKSGAIAGMRLLDANPDH